MFCSLYEPKGNKASKILSEDGQLVGIGRVDQSSKFTSQQFDFINDTIKIQVKIINSLEFKQRFLRLKAYQTNGRSTASIYRDLVMGKNKLSDFVDYDLDYCIGLYTPKSARTIGKTMMQTGKIYVSRYFFNRWMKKRDFASFGSHLFHEYLHSMGLTHWGWRYFRNKSLVYQGGYLMKRMIKEILANDG